MASPIQVILNQENFQEARDAGGGGPRKDFFALRDAAFVKHKVALGDQLCVDFLGRNKGANDEGTRA